VEKWGENLSSEDELAGDEKAVIKIAAKMAKVFMARLHQR
jgi:hypothetical protein